MICLLIPVCQEVGDLEDNIDSKSVHIRHGITAYFISIVAMAGIGAGMCWYVPEMLVGFYGVHFVFTLILLSYYIQAYTAIKHTLSSILLLITMIIDLHVIIALMITSCIFFRQGLFTVSTTLNKEISCDEIRKACANVCYSLGKVHPNVCYSLGKACANVCYSLSNVCYSLGKVQSKCKSPEEYDNCPICLVPMEKLGGTLRILSCAHRFHIECIEQWLEYNSNCPICRNRVSN